jgi:septal ring factor EnvC (AmiA/AmiB activator)
MCKLETFFKLEILKSRMIILLILTGLVTTRVIAQSKTELEKEKERLSKEIKASNELLNEVKKDKEVSIGELNVLDKQVKNREELIENFSQQLITLKSTIENTDNEINGLTKELEKNKAEYAEMIRYAYKTKSSYDVLVFLFAANDFNDAYKRLKYIRYYNDYREEKVKEIEKKKLLLNTKKAELESQKQEQAVLVESEKQEKAQILKEKSRTSELVKKLSGKEKDLKSKITKKKAEIERLDKEIKSIIAKEIARKKAEAAAAAKAKAEREAKAANKPNVTSSSSSSAANPVYSYTPEDTKLANSFIANKGKLPWPLERGTITQGFGIYSHPVHKDVKIENNGVNISTIKNAPVRAVFEGTVLSIIYSPTFQFAIIISHGSFFSVYSNVVEARVAIGDKVNTKETIGTVYTDSEENKTELHLEIWREQVPENPERWIAR